MPTFNRSEAGVTVQDYLDLEGRTRILVVDIGGGLVDIDPTGGPAGAVSPAATKKKPAAKSRRKSASKAAGKTKPNRAGRRRRTG